MGSWNETTAGRGLGMRLQLGGVLERDYSWTGSGNEITAGRGLRTRLQGTWNETAKSNTNLDNCTFLYYI